MARSLAVLGALVALAASLTAMLLAWLQGGGNSWLPDFIENFLEGTLLYGALGLVVVSVLVVLVAVVLAPAGPSRRTRTEQLVPPPKTIEKVVYRTDPEVSYRAAVEMAWADRKLSKAEEKRLGALELELEISGGRAEEIERQVMRKTREAVTSEDEPVTRYRTAVEMAWADKRLSKKEGDHLGALETKLGLSRDRTSAIEREVMGGAREEMVSEEPTPTTLDGAWEKLAEDCVDVVDELDRNMASFDPERQELADHVILRIEEVLERSGVDVISEDATFDSKRHRLEKATTKTSPGAHITETLSPGFAVGRRVLRRAKVRVE